MRLFLCSIAVLICTISASGSIVFSNVTSTTGSGIAGGILAAEFSPTANYQLTSASAFLMYTGGAGPNAFNFFIYSNNSGAPGSQLTSLSTTIPQSLNETLLITASNPTSPLTLLSGTNYWLVIPIGNLTGLSWLTQGNSTVLSAVENLITHSWISITQRSLQFEIDGTQVTPEPGTFFLVAAAFIVLGFVGFRRAMISQ